MSTSTTPSTTTPPSSSAAQISVLFVCLGNICRSTMAEGVFRSLTQPSTSPSSPSSPHPLLSTIDSCGTGAYHLSSPPDPRTTAVLKSHNIAYTHRARKLRKEDFDEFDYVLAMDRENLEDIESLRRRGRGSKGGEGKAWVGLFGSVEFGGRGRRGEEVEDPYYGGEEGFDLAYEQCVRLGKGFLEYVEREHGGKGEE